jgi:hypothetical protein
MGVWKGKAGGKRESGREEGEWEGKGRAGREKESGRKEGERQGRAGRKKESGRKEGEREKGMMQEWLSAKTIRHQVHIMLHLAQQAGPLGFVSRRLLSF